jgi:hypothetical protein
LFAKHVNVVASLSLVFASVNWMSMRTRHSGRLRLVFANAFPIFEELWDSPWTQDEKTAALMALML